MREVARKALEWMPKVMDKVSGGVMQELGSRSATLQHLVARRSQEVVVRTRAVRDFQKSPTLEDLEGTIGHRHAPQYVRRHRQLDMPRPRTPDPSRPEGCHRRNDMPQARRGCFGTG